MLTRTLIAPLLFVLLLGAGEGVAQSRAAPSRDQRAFANEVVNESVNTTTLFASQDIFSTGRFAKHRIDQPDTQYNTLRAPFEVRLTKKGDRWQPYLYGSAAMLRVSSGSTKPLGADGSDDAATSDLFSFAAGFGSYLRVSDEFKLAASAAVAYSRLRSDYDFNNSFSQEVLKPDNDLFYSWNLSVLTYAPTIRAIYEREWSESILNYTLGYSQLLNDSVTSSSSAIDIHSASGLLWNRLSYSHPTGADLLFAPASLRPFFQWSNISGKAADGLNLVHLYEVGADIVLNFKEKFLVFSQMHWGGSYVTGDSFEGYHIGFGGKF